MNSDPIQKLLQETDKQRSFAQVLDPVVLTDRVLKTRSRRRNTRVVSSVAVIALSVTILWVANREKGISTQQLAINAKPAANGRIQLDQELRDLQEQIAANDQIIRRLNAVETIQRADAEIARLQSRDFSVQDITERAASAVVYQTDRMYRATGQSASALQAYRQVIEYFPDTVSAEQARQRVADIERAG
jgi:TolA-binding protein